jgi:peptide/nickel transport system permease protein
MALAMVAILGPGERNVMIAVAAAGVAGYIRLVRGEVLGMKNRDFIEAAQALGSSRFRIMFRHIFPNIISPILVIAMLDVAGAIQAMAGMSYLGMGAQPPAPAWGKMVAEGQSYLTTAWWVAVLPGIAVAVSVLGINLFGDGLRNLIDPKLPRAKKG